MIHSSSGRIGYEREILCSATETAPMIPGEFMIVVGEVDAGSVWV